jgi:TPR repeat protein
MAERGDKGTPEFEALKRRAEAGDAGAQYSLGLAFSEGAHGVKPYRPSAIAWCFKAATQGHIGAQARLGAMFLDEAVKRNSLGDTEKARTWLTKAATQGNVDAMYHLGVLLNKGCGLPPKPKAARGWFDSAANAGNVAALNQIGLIDEKAKDYVAAAKSFHAGAEKGDINAQYNFARCLRDGKGVEKDVEQARQLFQSAADLDLPEAQCALGRMLLDEKASTRSLKLAQRWFQQAATRGDANGQYETAEGFRQGRGTTVDFGRAIAFFRMAADQGHASAMFGLGAMFESGAGFREPKLNDAAAIYRRAAMAGHAGAAHNFGIMLTRGIGVETNKQRAREVLEQAVGLGADAAMATLAQLLMSDGDLVGAAKWTFLSLEREPEGPAQKLLESLRSHLPIEALVDAEKRARLWRRKMIEVDWG